MCTEIGMGTTAPGKVTVDMDDWFSRRANLQSARR